MAENGNQGEAPKIHVDDDWKAQAQAEKERLAREAEAKAKAAPKAGAAPAGGAAAGPRPAAGGSRELPEANFTTLISSLFTQAMMAMGAVRAGAEKPFVDLGLAKFHIESLRVLEEKTRGNLDDNEKRVLDQALYELRMRYVQMAQGGPVGGMPGGGGGQPGGQEG